MDELLTAFGVPSLDQAVNNEHATCAFVIYSQRERTHNCMGTGKTRLSSRAQ
jgi:hypothetical protein